MNRIVKSTVFVALIALAATPMFALTASDTMQVTANVARVCTIATLTDLDFGDYDPVVTNLAAVKHEATAGQLTVACTKNSNGVTIEFAAAPADGWNMKGAVNGDSLPFTLSQDQWATVWGAGANAMTLTPPATKAAQTINVYGTIPANQDVSVDSYVTTVTATINF